MNNLQFDKKRSESKGKKRNQSFLRPFTLLGTLVGVLVVIATMVFAESMKTAESEAAASGMVQAEKRYKATKDIVFDRTTGQLRKPDERELDEMISFLRTKTKRTDADLKPLPLPNGGEALYIKDGFSGVLLARAGADGSLETKCVFTFEEAKAFLGLVELDSKTKGE